MWGLVVGAVAAVTFPLVAVAVHRRLERRRNRKACRRRTQKIRL